VGITERENNEKENRKKDRELHKEYQIKYINFGNKRTYYSIRAIQSRVVQRIPDCKTAGYGSITMMDSAKMYPFSEC
jgi:hypothetical protein